MLLHISIDRMKATNNIDSTLFSVVCGLQHEGDNFLATALVTDVYKYSKISKLRQLHPFHQLLEMENVKVYWLILS